MTASPFLTRIESYRDPKALWPLAAGLSGLAHGILILSLQPWAKVAPSVADSLPTIPIPIQLVALDTRATVFSAPETVPETVPETALGTPLHQSAAPPQPGSPPIPADAQAVNPEPSQPSPPNTPTRPPQAGPTILPNPPSTTIPDSVTQPNVPPAPIPPSAPHPAADSPVEGPTLPPDPISPAPSALTPEPTLHPSPFAPTPPTAAGGQLVPLGISATPYGSDWPDAPPQLLSTAEIALTPWLEGCGVTNLGMIASPGTTMRMQIRVRVETDGTISAAYVDTSSGNPALDNLVSCIGQRQLRLAPAMAAGQPTITDAYQVEVQVQF